MLEAIGRTYVSRRTCRHVFPSRAILSHFHGFCRHRSRADGKSLSTKRLGITPCESPSHDRPGASPIAIPKSTPSYNIQLRACHSVVSSVVHRGPPTGENDEERCDDSRYVLHPLGQMDRPPHIRATLRTLGAAHRRFPAFLPLRLRPRRYIAHRPQRCRDNAARSFRLRREPRAGRAPCRAPS